MTFWLLCRNRWRTFRAWKNGLKCVGHAEIDIKASTTYKYFFDDDRNYKDLTKIDINKLPDFDFLISGFPCQTFSIVGKRAGFKDTRGQIIYSLIEIMKQKNVKYFILENVKGLTNHNKGETFKIIKQELQNAGYNIYFKVLNSINYGVLQSRERIYMVGFRMDLDNKKFEFLKEEIILNNIDNFIDPKNNLEFNLEDDTFQKYLSNKYNQNKLDKDEILKLENHVFDWRQSDLRIYKNYFPTLRTGRHGIILFYLKQEAQWR